MTDNPTPHDNTTDSLDDGQLEAAAGGAGIIDWLKGLLEEEEGGMEFGGGSFGGGGASGSW